MKVTAIALASLAFATDFAGAFSFTGSPVANAVAGVSSSQLSMVLEKPRTKKAKVKKISKLEILKKDSDNLVHPLQEVSYACNNTCPNFCGDRVGRAFGALPIRRERNPNRSPAYLM